jgi:hypothetical protein
MALSRETAKLCECGCGQPAPISDRSRSRLGLVKGQPRRFRKGHQSKGRAIPAADRFWPKVDKDLSSGCWNWTASLVTGGYGGFADDQLRPVRAHRFAYELLVGPIPAGLHLDHLCRNRRCVNPAHLEPVTNPENVLRGEGPTAQLAQRTHCKNGHPLSDENVLLTSERRHCRACSRERRRSYDARDRAQRG